MKKLFSLHRFNRFILKRGKLKKRNKKYIPNYRRQNIYKEIHEYFTIENHSKKLIAPYDFRFIDNIEDCLYFLKKIREDDSILKINNKKYIYLDFSNIYEIDYAMISILIPVMESLNRNKIQIFGNFPKNPECKDYLIESGFLNFLTDFKGKKYKKVDSSEIILFEKGENILSKNDNIRLSNKIKLIREYLTGINGHFNPLKTILLEICGNSIEHNSIEKRWCLGIKFDNDKVICTVTDLGNGILETIRRKFSKQISDAFSLRSDVEILKRAFIQKYGSSTGEANRNKGLPSIKESFDKNYINNLLVVTNNVILQFNTNKLSKTFNDNLIFTGTFYQWEMDKNSFNIKK
jgi:hypothetical protein